MLVTSLVLIFSLLGLILAVYYAYLTAKIQVKRGNDPRENLLNGASEDPAAEEEMMRKVRTIAGHISSGAQAFLIKEYQYISVFMVFFSILLTLLLGFLKETDTVGAAWKSAALTTVAFIAGGLTSTLSGYIGMRIAVFSNSRTAIMARFGYGEAFVTAFRAGAVMGFSLVSLGLLVLWALISLYSLFWPNAFSNINDTKEMFEAIAGFGLGGSSIALFGRVGGGIYTKAADVGADLVGKVENGLDEDDPRNPAVIADNVGDNVGDIAGMGADLFGSFAEASCAAMVISSQSIDLFANYTAMCFPLLLMSSGIGVSILTSLIATHIRVVRTKAMIEPALKLQIIVSTVLMTPTTFLICWLAFPATPFVINEAKTGVMYWHVFVCVMAGLWSGLVIGLMTEYFTSNAYRPVQRLADACETGAATNIIHGLALGYKSTIVPVFCLAVTIYISYSLAGMYGIAVAALGILSTLATGLTIDAYGPICDNAGGIAEMAGMPNEVRNRTDDLDAAGNTTAAIGKGFAIGSAALVSLALFGAFVTTKGLKTVDILQPFPFAGLLVGAMLPYWFSAMTMKSVGDAAQLMVEEVRRQVREHPGILDGTEEPDHEACVAISTDASLREMIPPGCLVMLTPIVVGFLFGPDCLAGVLAGSLVSGVQVAISASNTGGAWDNAKKFIEAGALGEGKGKGSREHEAAVIGDTVGDPLKDTSGPAINILIKLSAIISLVFAPALPAQGQGLIERLFA